VRLSITMYLCVVPLGAVSYSGLWPTFYIHVLPIYYKQCYNLYVGKPPTLRRLCKGTYCYTGKIQDTLHNSRMYIYVSSFDLMIHHFNRNNHGECILVRKMRNRRLANKDRFFSNKIFLHC
jgi:hypothetical protein